ncbi:phosphoglucomutase, alpha-D-glucose phosphate-specific [Desulfobacter postgatei]|jgi:phosphoglucomutase|uniref:phosphoglucomutase, alpha-D-glucose phosphate-specific n=1 Tax=Desulfobacter postgatei TaxID=2293 RepID=UPI002A35A3ED|nr:phosphoglucomutase, alpha-D-glucose phosphate-specific [Desulfobacter postgatei]MDX9962187.1 phosphoglucomutase, alpha-D-glucose phosphate-specific [Desulfobacter postgatei]
MEKRNNTEKIVSSYYSTEIKGQVSFGTSGHRGSSLDGTFNEKHILSISQALCDYRKKNKISGPLFLGYDTHALSLPAFKTALEVFAANDVDVFIHANSEYTPTPVISFMILEYNRTNKKALADGVIITPSHNPPEDGGFKYNPPHGGPADIEITDFIEKRANQLITAKNSGIKRIAYEKAYSASSTHERDFITPYVDALSNVIDTETLHQSKIKIGIDPMGGAGVNFWDPIADKYGFDINVVNSKIDKTFSFMPPDHDGKIRMDCSSPHAMANLIKLAEKYDIAWGNDPDFDRHGIVCPDGLMNPNHYLSVAIWYLLQNRPLWGNNLSIGKTLVSSSMIDKVVMGFNKAIFETPVGFKWFVSGLMEGKIAFCGEESAGATFLRKNGAVWTTDKDGFVLALLAAEILAKTGQTPSEIYRETLVSEFGNPYYRRVDGPITNEQKTILSQTSPDSIKATSLAGLSIVSIQTKATGNDSPIGGVKVNLSDGSWFAIRPSGTEPKMKLYIESFGGEDLWKRIHDEALNLIFRI